MSLGKKIWQFATSPSLALKLIAVVTIVTIFGVLIKVDKTFTFVRMVNSVPFTEKLGLQNVFDTRWYMFLVFLIFINTVACTVKQALNRKKTWTAFTPVIQFKAAVDEEFMDKAARVLRRKRYRVAVEGKTVKAEKNMLGYGSSVVFHTGIIIIIAGAFLSVGLRMSGRFPLFIGGTFTDMHKGYYSINEGPLFGEKHGQFELELNGFEMISQGKGKIQSMESLVTVSKDNRILARGKTNFSVPLKVGNFTFYQFNLFGYAPTLVVDNPDGLKNSYVLIMNTIGSPPNYRFIYDFVVPNTPFQVSAELFPDYNGIAGKPATRSWEIRNPVLKLMVKDNEGTVFSGILPASGSVSFAGYKVSMPQVRYWSSFNVVNDRGLSVIYAGFFVLSLGAAMIYLYVPQKIQFIGTDDGVNVGGWSPRYKVALTDELNEVISAILKERSPGH